MSYASFLNYMSTEADRNTTMILLEVLLWYILYHSICVNYGIHLLALNSHLTTSYVNIYPNEMHWGIIDLVLGMY